MTASPAGAPVIVFDVNETLLDLSALDPLFQRHFGDAGLRRLWFAQVLQTSLLQTVLEEYRDFGICAAAALDLLAARTGHKLDAVGRDAILSGLRTLPAHPEVPRALEKLAAAGLRLATLTNSSTDMVASQLAAAGIDHCFEAVLSVDRVRRFKPARAVYDMAAQTLGAAPADLWLVAAHNWDTTGALSAGWNAAFVQRPGMALGPLDRTPAVTGQDLQAVAEELLRCCST
jgi:2-haloacid dehalogenase